MLHFRLFLRISNIFSVAMLGTPDRDQQDLLLGKMYREAPTGIQEQQVG